MPDGQATSPEVKIQSAPAEIAEVKPPVTPQQEVQAAIRGIFFESDSRLAELPKDIKYGRYGSAVGNFTQISGTFDGRFLELKDAPELTGLHGKADGQSLPDEEAKSLWDQINPVAEKFHEYQLAEEQALRELAEKQTRQQAEEKAIVTHEHDLEDEKKRVEVRDGLNKNLEGLEMSDEDREFIKKVVEDVADLTVLRDRDGVPDETTSASVYNVLRIRSGDSTESQATTSEKLDEYNRRKDIVFKLLGADASKPHVWQAGFGVIYIHSRVYDTTLPTIVIREAYENEYHRVGMDSQLHIERNSMYAKAG